MVNYNNSLYSDARTHIAAHNAGSGEDVVFHRARGEVQALGNLGSAQSLEAAKKETPGLHAARSRATTVDSVLVSLLGR